MQQFLVERSHWGLDGYELRFRVKDEHRILIPKEVEFEEHERNQLVSSFLKLDESGIQSLINELWIAGIRPSNKLVEPQNNEYIKGEIKWLRETADHLMKKPK